MAQLRLSMPSVAIFSHEVDEHNWRAGVLLLHSDLKFFAHATFLPKGTTVRGRRGGLQTPFIPRVNHTPLLVDLHPSAVGEPTTERDRAGKTEVCERFHRLVDLTL